MSELLILFKGGSITTASFAVAWNAFVLFWTVGALSAGNVRQPWQDLFMISAMG